MWKVDQHKTVCTKEESGPETLEDSSDGHDGNLAGEKWQARPQQLSASVQPLWEDEVPLVILTDVHQSRIHTWETIF